MKRFTSVILVWGAITFGSGAGLFCLQQFTPRRVAPETIDLGDVVAGDELDVSLDLCNRSGEDLEIESITPDCSCVLMGSVPRRLQRGECKRVRLSSKWVERGRVRRDVKVTYRAREQVRSEVVAVLANVRSSFVIRGLDSSRPPKSKRFIFSVKAEDPFLIRTCEAFGWCHKELAITSLSEQGAIATEHRFAVAAKSKGLISEALLAGSGSQGMLMIATSNPSEPFVVIDFTSETDFFYNASASQ